jgi:hypothetical protein
MFYALEKNKIELERNIWARPCFFHMTNSRVLISQKTEKRRKKKNDGRTVGILHIRTDCSNDQKCVHPEEYGSNSYRKERSKNAIAITASHYHHYPLSSCSFFYQP